MHWQPIEHELQIHPRQGHEAELGALIDHLVDGARRAPGCLRCQLVARDAGQPWLLGQVMSWLQTGQKIATPGIAEQYAVLVEHYLGMLEHYGEDTGAKIARKHLGWYTKGLPGSAEFRNMVNFVDDPAQVLDELERFYAPLIGQDPERRAA